jgi:hypothetical protein
MMQSSMNENYVEQVREGVLDWMESVRDRSEGWGRWKYNAHMQRPHGLISTRFALAILEQFGVLESIGAKEKAEAIAYLQSCQDTDGFFKDPLVSAKDLSAGHSYVMQDLWMQMDATGALKVLGAKPLHAPPKQVHSDLQGEEGLDWLRGLDWTNPWLEGERFNRAVAALRGGVYAWSSKNPPGATPLDPEVKRRMASLEELFHFLETKVMSPGSGLPDAAGCKHPDVAMAGLFKLLFAYIDAERPYPYAAQAIDSVLAMQSEAGDFAPRFDLPTPDGSTYVIRYAQDMCINWDALWVLRQLDKELKGQHRHADIARAAQRLAECLLRDYRKPDGGFAFAAEHCLLIHQAVKISKPFPEGDMVGAFMCLECLRYADEWRDDAK